MPRIQSYVPSSAYKRMEEIIEELSKDGADRSEANISSLVARLVEMGLILWDAKNKDESEQINEQVGDDINSLHMKEILIRAMRAESFSRMNLQISLMPDLTKSEMNYKQVKAVIEQNVDEAVELLFNS